MSNTDDNAAVLELLASRICHDIISPVGAVNNGVEFMEEMGPDAAEEGLKLIAYSAEQASAKLSAFRIAYGAGGRDKNLKPEDIQKAFSALVSAEGKISQTWDPYGNLGPNPLPFGYCKMLMCTMMLAMEALPKGGRISVIPGGDNQSHILAEGDDVSLRDQVQEALSHTIDVADLDPRLVHPYTVGVLAKHYGYSIDIESSESKVTFILNCPSES